MKTKKLRQNYHRRGITPFRRKILCLIALFFFSSNIAFANPIGPQVINGNVSFNTQGNTLTITNSPNSIINWQGFSIGVNELTRFLQQSGNSAILNRVIGQDPSAILGALQSNGRVFLINPNGILFGQGARIDVNGLIASTLNLSNQDFLAGKYNFTAGIKAGSIENQGTITTPMGGQVYLIAPDIKNSGIINSPKGDVILAAGHSVQLVDSADPFIAVTISAPENSVVNLGQIIADSGRIGIYGGLISQKGIVRADSAVAGENGQILFKATNAITLDKDSITSANGPQGGKITIQSETDTTLVSGAVTATGSEGKGGEIQVLGRQVGLIDNALVDASGKSGGGTVLVGGDYQGKNPEVQNAVATYIGADAAIRADATEAGDGGKVILWADDATLFYGNISARGGMLSGNGGFAEVSGKNRLTYKGWADMRAPYGKTGNLLLDPANFTIAADGGDITGDDVGIQLGSANLTLQTSATGSDTGNLTVADSITWSNTNTLTLKAHNDVTVTTSGTITADGGGSLLLRADSDANGAGTVTFLPKVEAYHVIMSGGSGTAEIFYNPSSYASPTNYSSYFYGVVPTAYMLVNNVSNLQDMNTNLSGKYALGANIDASATSGWNSGAGFLPVGTTGQGMSFAGTFDGLGHTISNLTINRPGSDNIGMFGVSTGLVKNIGLLGGSVTGGSFVGRLVGSNGGTISNSYNTGSITGVSVVGGLAGESGGTISNSYSTGSVSASGQKNVGGLVGYNSGTVTNSHATGNVSSTGSSGGDGGVGGLVGEDYGGIVSNSYATGNVSSSALIRVGGLVGWRYHVATGAISNSYATGNVSGVTYVGGLVGEVYGISPISNSYATGSVSGTNMVGGLVGNIYYNGSGIVSTSYSTGFVTGTGSSVGGLVGQMQGSGGAVNTSYWDTETSGKSQGLGMNYGGTFNATGRTTAEMQTAANFSAWDMNIWGIKNNVSYPYLKWRFSDPPQIISGMLDVTGGGKAIKLTGNGTLLDRAFTGANGFYYFAIPSSSVVSGDALLTYISGNATKGASVYLAAGGDMTGNYLYSNTLFAKSLSGGTMSNSTLANAKGSLSDADIPYSVVSNNLTVDSGLAFKTPSGTVYDLNGNVTTQGASQIYSGALTLSTNAVLNTGTGGNISFGDTLTGAGFSLTAESTDGLTVGGNITTQGGDVSLTATAGDITIANTVNAGTGSVTLNAGGAVVNGVTTADKNVIANSLDATAGNGIGDQNAMQTEVSNLTAENTNAGGGNRNIEFDNTGALTITDGITSSGSGNIILDNTGAIDTGSQKIQASQGDVTITAHSPLTIGSGGLTADGDVTLEAAKSGGNDTLTINGPVRSNNGNVYLAAGSGIVLNSTVLAPNGKVTRTVNGVLVIDSLTSDLLQAVTQWENTSTFALNNTYISTVEQDNARTAPPPEKKEDEDEKKGSAQSEEKSKAKLPYCN